MKHLVVGYLGEVGQCIYKFLAGEDIRGIDINIYETIKEKCSYMHVCIPYSETFVCHIKKYIRIYKPKYVIVYSTVLPGTCRALGKNVVHSPIEGQHPDLLGCFKTFTRLIAGNKSKKVAIFFDKKGLSVETFNKPEVTELGKLLSTTRYGINIVFAKHQEELCNKYKVPYQNAVLDYQYMYNKGYALRGKTRYIQPMLVPPGNIIGGHCVSPNAKLLEKISNSNLIKELANYGTGNSEARKIS